PPQPEPRWPTDPVRQWLDDLLAPLQIPERVGSYAPQVRDYANQFAAETVEENARQLADLARSLQPNDPQAYDRAYSVALNLLAQQPVTEPQPALPYDQALAQGLVQPGMTREDYEALNRVPEPWEQTIYGLFELPRIGVDTLLHTAGAAASGAAALAGAKLGINDADPSRAFESGMQQGSATVGDMQTWTRVAAGAIEKYTVEGPLGRAWSWLDGDITFREYMEGTFGRQAEAVARLGPAAGIVPVTWWNYIDAGELQKDPKTELARAKERFGADLWSQAMAHPAWQFLSELADPIDIAQFGLMGVPKMEGFAGVLDVVDNAMLYGTLASTESGEELAGQVFAQAVYQGMGRIGMSAYTGLSFRDTMATAATNPRDVAYTTLTSDLEGEAERLGVEPAQLDALARSFLYDTEMPETGLPQETLSAVAQRLHAQHEEAKSRVALAMYEVAEADPQFNWVQRAAANIGNRTTRIPAEMRALLAQDLSQVGQIPFTLDAVQAYHDAQDASPSHAGQLMASLRDLAMSEGGYIRRPGAREEAGPELPRTPEEGRTPDEPGATQRARALWEARQAARGEAGYGQEPQARTQERKQTLPVYPIWQRVRLHDGRLGTIIATGRSDSGEVTYRVRRDDGVEVGGLTHGYFFSTESALNTDTPLA
ncbi:MAG: hypothetical protein GX657_10485, partial [Chloroflexi bacterium]|nr:hypothetical protein [Chloroflexota bacterium]